jgi:uncharacterized damage-inducible protein DinB
VRQADLALLLDYGSWATHRLLAAAADLPVDRFTAPADATVRSLRATLVHALDVEWSWRLRLQAQVSGTPDDADQELREEDFPTAATLADRWRREERELRAWLDGLDEAQLAATVGEGDHARPRWQYILHLILHGFQQRADAATVLSRYGHSPGDLEFLGYLVRSRPAGDR